MSVESWSARVEGICLRLQRRTRRIDDTDVVCADKGGHMCCKVDVNRVSSGGGLTFLGGVKPLRTS